MARLHTTHGTTDYSDVGSGDPLVLLHATLHDRSDYDDVVHRFAKTQRVIALDWPGHGNSPLPSSGRPLSAGMFADVVQEFVDALDLDHVTVIGNSVGGYAACRLAATRPDRIKAIVTVNGAGFTPTNAAVRAYCRALGKPNVVRHLLPALVRAYMRAQSPHDEAIVERVAARARSNVGAQVAASMWRSFGTSEIDLTSYPERVTCPTLIVWGRKDLSIPTAWARRAHQAIAGSQFVFMDTGHVAFSSDPKGFLAVVSPFLAAIDNHDRNR